MIELANSRFYMATPPPPSSAAATITNPSKTKHSVSAPISPTIPQSPSTSMKSAKSNLLSLSTCSSSSSSPASSLSFFSKTDSVKTADEENLARKLRNLQITELINALLLVEGKLKREQKTIRHALRKKDQQISQQMLEIENYRNERTKHLCGLCQRPTTMMESEKAIQPQQHAHMKNAEVQTVDWTQQTMIPGGTSDGKAEEEPKSEEDWYANGGSDNENDKSTMNMNSQCVNPVLERVNQILLQESMDGGNIEPETPKAAVTKRVHFSTPQPSPRPTLNNNRAQYPELRKIPTVQMASCRIQSPENVARKMSVLENEYEMIGSESSNLYVDMDQKSSPSAHEPESQVEYKNVTYRRVSDEVLRLFASPGVPPALPPKPANLMRFKKNFPPSLYKSKELKNAAETENSRKGSEPDYCSISELSNDHKERNSGVNITGHDNNEDVESKADSEDNLENGPKLPNVTAIIVPKKSPEAVKLSPVINGNGLIINKDNYVTKPAINGKSLPQQSFGDAKIKSLSDPKRFTAPSARIINKSLIERRQNLLSRLSQPNPIQIQGIMTKRFSNDNPNMGDIEQMQSANVFQERIPIQAEFDWYNLDAEFGKFKDMIKEVKSSDSGSSSSSNEEISNKVTLSRNLNELKDIERKLSQEQKMPRRDRKEIIHYC